MRKSPQSKLTDKPQRVLLIPDLQVKPGAPTDHVEWIGQAIVDYEPDVVVHMGDHWDLASLNTHEDPGSKFMEGKRYLADIDAGNEAFELLSRPMEMEMARRKDWHPRRIFLLGNHEDRADRAVSENPRYYGHIGSEDCDTRDWERFPFLQIVNLNGFLVSHYFQATHSGRPIGGTVQNKLNKIGASFAHGHVQGLDVGTKLLSSGETWWGISCGSAYPHIEEYRGNQGQRHWRGIIVLNDFRGLQFDPMPVSLRYLCRKYAEEELSSYFQTRYPYANWDHLK